MLALSTVTGCAVQDAVRDEVGYAEATQEVVSANGISLNGISLNGISLNGTSLSGTSLNGVSVSGMRADGTSVSAASGTAQPLSGASFVGTKWRGMLSNGTTLPLRIESAIQGTGTSADVWMYGVAYQTSTTWSPLCGVDAANHPVLAVSVPGLWNTQQGVSGGGAYSTSTSHFTIACQAKTIAKCVELGYKPWTGYTSQLTSCVRLLRADYCGDGTPYTVDGQTLNLYDNVGVQADTEAWAVEGEWTPSGARCVTSVSGTRGYKTGSFANGTPSCFSNVLFVTPTCGLTFVNGAVLIDELP